MIAEVYPLMRLPRAKKVFDYLVGEEAPRRGSLVRIPYRNRELWGIVKRVKDKPPRGITLKTIMSVQTQGSIREEELSFFEDVAQDLAQSVSSVLYAAIPLPPKRPGSVKASALSWLPLTLPRSEAEHVARIVKTLGARGKAFVQTPDLRRAASIILGYIQSNPGQKILVLAPTGHDVKRIRPRLTGCEPVIITGQESNNERFAAWQNFRAMTSGILLGTRTALLAIDSTVTTVFLLRASDMNHKSLDRNPRYDARELVWQHHERFSSNLFCLDVAPQPSTVARFEELECLSWGVYPSARVIDVNKGASQSALRGVAYLTLEAIQECLQSGKQALCIYNRKGAGRDIRCGHCGKTFLCPSCTTALAAFSHTLECARCRYKEPRPLRCPDCRGSRLRSTSMGNVELAQELRKGFPEATIAIIDKEHPKQIDADILLVTTFYYEAHFDPFQKSNIGLVAHLDVDTPLYSTRPTAVEDLARDVWQWAWLGFASRALVLLQTSSPDLVESIVKDPLIMAKDELQARDRFHLPPSYRWARVVHCAEEDRKTEMAFQQLSEMIKAIPHAIVHPIGRDTKNNFVLRCGVPTESIHFLLDVFATLPDRYIIDTNTLT